MTQQGRLRVAAFPRDPNPYQRLLYDEMAKLGVDVVYLGRLTPSHVLNLLLLPGEVLVRRRRGLDVVHLHWVFGFGLPGRSRLRAVGLLSEAWFHVFLRTVAVSDLRLVWTAHNVLPHAPVFWDDVRARRSLVAAADLVLVHDAATLTALAELGMRPRASAVVPHGPFATTSATDRRTADRRDGPLTLAFVGAIADYKGVDDLVREFAALAPDGARLVVAGACTDPALAQRLRVLADPVRDSVVLRLERLTDEELDDVLRDADVLVLPYHQVTTSGTAMLGLAAGLPLVVPDLPGLAALPEGAVFRYVAPDGLLGALARVLGTPRDRLRAMGVVGHDTTREVSWAQIAETTVRLFRDLGRPAVPAR